MVVACRDRGTVGKKTWLSFLAKQAFTVINETQLFAFAKSTKNQNLLALKHVLVFFLTFFMTFAFQQGFIT